MSGDPDHSRAEVGEEPKTPKIVFSFNNWEVDSIDLGSLQLLQLLQNTATTAATYSSIIKEYLQKELREQNCKWDTKRLEEKAKQILDCNTGHG